MSDFAEIIDDIRSRLAELERRNRSNERTGVVHSIDPVKGLARVKLFEGNDLFLSPWIPWEEVAAGKNKTHIPPSVGQQVKVQGESGDLHDASIKASLNSDANGRPSVAGDEYVLLSVGDASVTVSGGGATMVLKVGASSIVLTDGNIKYVTPRLDLN